MTAILIVSDRDAGRAWSYPLDRDPFITIERVEDEDDAGEWVDPGHRVTRSADGGTCVRWGLDETEYPLRDLIEHAEAHVERHARGES